MSPKIQLFSLPLVVLIQKRRLNLLLTYFEHLIPFNLVITHLSLQPTRYHI